MLMTMRCQYRVRLRAASVLPAVATGCAFALLASVAAPAERAVQNPAVPRTSAWHEVSPHFFGVDIENSYSNPVPAWNDPKLLSAIERVGIQTVRFPGGDVGNYWDWQAGTVYPIGKASKTQDSLSALSNLAHNTRTVPVYNLNVMTLNNALVHGPSLHRRGCLEWNARRGGVEQCLYRLVKNRLCRVETH
jgi:hypothetical protein